MLIKHYPKPQNGLIIEPFAGGAVYSCRYWERDVFLYDLNKDVVDVWKFIQSDDAIDCLDYIPRKVKPGMKVDSMLFPGIPNGFEWLLRSAANVGVFGTNKTENTITKLGASHWYHNTISKVKYWNKRIKHWQVFNADFRKAPNKKATWFIDPPYSNGIAQKYKYNFLDYSILSKWIKSLNGQKIVCEANNAKWLPFKRLVRQQRVRAKNMSSAPYELIYVS